MGSSVPSEPPTAKVGYLFGYPIAHTLSPIVHHLVFSHLSLPYTYHLHESTSIPSFLALAHQPNFYGSAVTMPHKVSIIPHLDDLTPEGQAIGAINTVFPRPDLNGGPPLLVGTNTDCIGIREALRHNMSPSVFASCANKPALIIGGGGTSRAAVYALRTWLFSSTIYMINRDAAEVTEVVAECTARGFGANIIHVTSPAHAASLPPPFVIVSAIPDFPPQTPEELAAREEVKIMLERGKEVQASATLLEMCYHPSPDTAITALAEEKGWKVVPGTEAMVWQGLEQDAYWTGRKVEEMPVEEVKTRVNEALEKSRKYSNVSGALW